MVGGRVTHLFCAVELHLETLLSVSYELLRTNYPRQRFSAAVGSLRSQMECVRPEEEGVRRAQDAAS